MGPRRHLLRVRCEARQLHRFSRNFYRVRARHGDSSAVLHRLSHSTGARARHYFRAEFYAKGIGWIPIDASEAAKNPSMREYFFGTHDENRVEFTRGRDLKLTPVQASDPLNYFVYPYAEGDGKPVDELDRTFSWKDHSAAAATALVQ
jgi:hypothetical protein